jgi:hypothetical protein
MSMAPRLILSQLSPLLLNVSQKLIGLFKAALYNVVNLRSGTINAFNEYRFKGEDSSA